jgi:hypothetical protein
VDDVGADRFVRNAQIPASCQCTDEQDHVRWPKPLIGHQSTAVPARQPASCCGVVYPRSMRGGRDR